MLQITSNFEELAEDLPENLKYVLKNRLRISRALGDTETMELIAIIQL
jgi:hypothetical protein